MEGSEGERRRKQRGGEERVAHNGANEKEEGGKGEEAKEKQTGAGCIIPRIPFSVSFFSALPASQTKVLPERNSQPGILRTNQRRGVKWKIRANKPLLSSGIRDLCAYFLFFFLLISIVPYLRFIDICHDDFLLSKNILLNNSEL